MHLRVFDDRRTYRILSQTSQEGIEDNQIPKQSLFFLLHLAFSTSDNHELACFKNKLASVLAIPDDYRSIVCMYLLIP